MAYFAHANWSLKFFISHIDIGGFILNCVGGFKGFVNS